jgi:S-adenosylmethionine-diacylgycerolhomoserine-N-methlytransferase
MSLPELLADSRILLQLLRGRRRAGSAAERLQSFYAPQAQRYDAFRERMLHGRQELIDRLQVAQGGVVVELGGGTGSNAERFGERLATLRRYVVVDLCTALLDQARLRARKHPNMEPIEADAARFRLGEPAD